MPTTYFAGNKDTDFTFTGSSVSINTTTTNFRTANVGNCIQVSVGSTTDPPSPRFTTANFTANSYMWIHGEFTITGNNNATTANATMMRVLDAAGVARLVVRGTGTTGQLKVDKRNAAGSFTNLATTASGAMPGSVASPFTQHFDLFVQYGTSGLVQLWINSLLVATSGVTDVTTDGATQLAAADFASPNTAVLYSWSEIYVSDSITINGGLYRLNPLAAGNTQSFSPSTVANVNKTTIADGTFVSDVNNNDLSEWTTPVAVPAGFIIQSVVQVARVAVGLAGPQHFDWVVRTKDGTDNLAGVSNAPTNLFSNFPNYVWGINPKTGSAWLPADIAAGFNLGIKSLS